MEIHQASYVTSAVELSQCPADNIPEIAFIGRSNVGKSTLINMLCGYSKLAKTSGSPGKTQTINFFNIDDSWRLVDLPGYGYAKVAKTQRAKWKIMIRNYLEKRTNLLLVFMLIDLRIPPQQLDLEFMRNLGEMGVPFSLVYTKTEKIKDRKKELSRLAFEQEALKEWDALPPHFISSGLTGTGKAQILDYIEHCLKSSAT